MNSTTPQHPSTAFPPATTDGAVEETAPDEHDLFAALLSTESPNTSDAPEERARVIPLGDTADWDLRVSPPSAPKGAENRFIKRSVPGVRLSPRTRELLFQAAVDPAALAEERVKRQRVGTGWLYRIDDVRLFTPMVNLSPANDRLLGDAVYAADPAYDSADAAGRAAVPMPTSHPEYAALVYTCARKLLREASDANQLQVTKDNPIAVGARIIEQPITLVSAIFAIDVDMNGLPVEDPDTASPEEAVAVDGNSRTAAAFVNIKFPGKLLPARLQSLYGAGETRVEMRPSLLSQMTMVERRDLTRKLIKYYSDIVDKFLLREKKNGSLTDGDLRASSAAARALNSLTVPATVIVGYVDDEDDVYGNSRFSTAVREVLLGMNVAPKAFGHDAKSGVSAEQAVVALHDACLLGGNDVSDTERQAAREALIGRTPVADAMTPLGLPPLADLRAALVVRELTRPGPSVTAALRKPLNVRQVHLKHRADAVVELIVRGYTARKKPDEIKQMRKVLQSGSGGCLWQDLLRTPWEVINVKSDTDVDNLAKLALTQLEAGEASPRGALCFIGVLGMTALVAGQYLLAAGGSGEATAAELEEATGRVPIHRGSVGSVVDSLLHYRWGVLLLADAIKRSRAGEKPRLIDPVTGEFDDDTVELSTAQINAKLRRMLKTAGEPDVDDLTQADRQRNAFESFAAAVTETKDAFVAMRDVYAESGEKIDFVVAEATLKLLDAVGGNFRELVAAPPLDFS